MNQNPPDNTTKPRSVDQQQGRSPLGDAALCWEQSNPRLGWTIRRIMRANGDSVTLNDGVSFCSPCFAGAFAGDIWAVCHTAGGACFGQAGRAILLEPARHIHGEPNTSHQAPAELDAANTTDATSRLPACAGSPSNLKPSTNNQ